LNERRLGYASFGDLRTALARGETDAVVDSIGTLQYAVATGYSGAVEPPESVLLTGSALKKQIDEALVEIIASAERGHVEES
jgi:ABC-type amino acid transport substrate-binding protein